MSELQSERLKSGSTYTLKVAPKATKIEITNALRRFYDVEVKQVRVMRVRSKTRAFSGGVMQKRHPYKKAMVTLSKDSKALDVAAFRT